MKIDRSFIAQLEDESREGDVFLEAMTTIATALMLTTVAEGIETESQAKRVRDAGCQRAQGFLFARPARIEDVIRSSLDSQSLVNC
jgi:EAL domain-containing protein (putative c-di-GMP-specific phosphodiesterase class I)